MFTEQDHFLGQLLAAAIELMLGDKALITHAGSCPHGFYAQVYPPFPLGEGYFKPLQENMQKFIDDGEAQVLEMSQKNAILFAQSLGKKRLAKKIEGLGQDMVQLFRVHNYIALYPYGLGNVGKFSVDRLESIERGGFRVFGHRTEVDVKENFHLNRLSEVGEFFKGDFLFKQKGLECRGQFIRAFEKAMEGVQFVDTGPWSKETFHRVKMLQIPFTTQVGQCDVAGDDDPFSGLKGIKRITTDQFFYLVESEKVEEGISSCLRLIEKWIKILGIRGNFTERGRGRVSWMVQDPFGTTFEGPYVERHPSGCLTGSLMGPLELMIAIHAEEKFTWNLENQESMSKSAFHKFV